jgi:cell division septation protein DedD
MSQRKRIEMYSDRGEGPRERKAYRFEMTGRQLFGFSFCAVVVLCWMFVFGVLIGRGISFSDPKDSHWKSRFLQFMGLTKEVEPVTENAARTWEDPKKMLENLQYYEDLTQKEGNENPAPSPKQGTGKTPAGAKSPQNESADHKTAASAPTAPSGEKPEPGSTAPTPSQKASDDSGPPAARAEHFTLLVSSVRDVDNAHRLIEQLRGKHYDPRIETIDLSGSGRWNRILIGSFRSREEALRFAAEFNRKEHMEGLVIREGD